MRYAFPALLITLALSCGCKRNAATSAPTIARAPTVAGPSTEDDLESLRADELKKFNRLESLGDSIPFKTPEGENWFKFSNGMMIQELNTGTAGSPPRLGQTVSVVYVGTLPGSNKEFDRNSRENPLKFRMGSKDLIHGFSLALSTMHLHGKRRVYLPPDLAYGAEGHPPIPPNQPLIFELELLDVSGAPLTFPDTDFPALPQAGPPAPTPASEPATQPAK